MKKSVKLAQRYRAGIKSVLLTACLGLALAACQKTPDGPMPPQAPPKPKATANVPDAGNGPSGLYDASNVSSAVYRYKSSEVLQYQNAQGRPVKRLVIRT